MSFNHPQEAFLDDDSSDRFQAVYQCCSAAFLTDRERDNVENGGKILLPQTALEQLIEEVCTNTSKFPIL